MRKVCETKPDCPFISECQDNIDISTYGDLAEGCMMDYMGNIEVLKEYGIGLSYE